MLTKKELKEMYKNAFTEEQRLELTKVLLLYELLTEVKKGDKVRLNSISGEEA